MTAKTAANEKSAMAKSSAAPAHTSALSIELLRQTAEKLLTQAKSRRETAALCERATESELKASKAMAEQMTGRKLDLVSTSVADSKRDARMNRNIAEKLEIEAAQLSAFANAHQALYEALSAHQLVAEFEAATDPRDRIRLLESIGDYESGWKSTDTALEVLKVRAALLTERALALADAAQEGEANG